MVVDHRVPEGYILHLNRNFSCLLLLEQVGTIFDFCSTHNLWNNVKIIYAIHERDYPVPIQTIAVRVLSFDIRVRRYEGPRRRRRVTRNVERRRWGRRWKAENVFVCDADMSRRVVQSRNTGAVNQL